MIQVGQPTRITAAGAQNITGADSGGRVHRVVIEGAATACLIIDASGTIASVSGQGSHELGIPFAGQLQVNRTAGTAATVIWS